MAGVEREAIETFISITGASESVALQKLEVYDGDLNAAVNAYYTESLNASCTEENRTNNLIVSGNGGHDDIVDIEDPMDVDAETSLPPQKSAPSVSRPREVREVPVHKDETVRANNHLPIIEDVAALQQLGTDLPGTVIIDDDDDDEYEVAVVRTLRDKGKNIEYQNKSPGTIGPRNKNFSNLNNEIEEQMIRAAIEASKLETGRHIGHQIDLSDDHIEDAPAEWGMQIRHQGTSSFYRDNLKEEGISTSINGRQGSSRFNGKNAIVFSSDEEADIDGEPLLQRRSQRYRRRFLNRTEDSTTQVETLTSNPVSHPEPQDPVLQQNGGLFQSDEWGGISSEEHDEAVMLEAAMFGGVPERSSYSFGYSSQSSSGLYQLTPRSPSPTLTAQRLLREQQDDEYHAALQADQERELKAHEAAVKEENLRKEEEQRKLREKEEFERQLSAKQASLPAEPSPDDENAVTLLIRMPNGDRCGRRFLKSDKIQCLFNFIDTDRLVAPGTYRLVRPYPRRVFGGSENDMTFNELGLSSKQEALFLELI